MKNARRVRKIAFHNAWGRVRTNTSKI